MNPGTESIPADWRLPSRGRVGMACLILTETAFFAIFVVAHLFYLGKRVWSDPTPPTCSRCR